MTTTDESRIARFDPWPALPLREWDDTYATLHRWTQIVGKTRLALAPIQNHWWHVTLYLTSRGLGTSPMPIGDRTIEVDFDFIDHSLPCTGEGDTREMAPLRDPSLILRGARRHAPGPRDQCSHSARTN